MSTRILRLRKHNEIEILADWWFLKIENFIGLTRKQ